MTKKTKYILIGISSAFAFILFLVASGYILNYLCFESMSSLPKGEYLKQSTSPNGKYTIKTYLTNGGATTSYGIRGELIVNGKNNKPKNIYWDYKIDHASITWLDDDTVTINNHKIDLPDGVYDFRKHRSDE
jgi:hypothetical protein